MADTPIPGVVYTRIYPSRQWDAPGRPSLNVTDPGGGGGGGAFTPLVLRVDKPDATNTGVGLIRPAPTVVASSADGTWSNGVLTITRDLKDRIVLGTVKIGANDLTVENCDIRGDASNPATNSLALRMVSNTGFTGATVRYCEIHATFNNGYYNGIGDRNITAEFNNIHHVTDGLKPNPPSGSSSCNMIVRGNYVHDMMFYAPDPSHGESSATDASGNTLDPASPWFNSTTGFMKPVNHADCVQFETDGMTGFESYGNNYVARSATDSISSQPLPTTASGAPVIKQLSVFMLNAAGGTFHSEDDWIDGGEYTANNGPSGAGLLGWIKRAKAGRRMCHSGSADSTYFVLMGFTANSPSFVTPTSGADANKFADTGAIVPRR